MNVHDIDLNLLVAFDALMQERNLTRAGGRIGLSQPSMSHALGRLRELWGDPLFVRIRTGMQPTPFAERISATVHDGLALLSAGLDSTMDFKPSASRRSFDILMSDIGELTYLPRLMRRMAELAPGVNVRVLQLRRELYRQTFESGEVDLAIGFLPALQAGFYQQRLFGASYVCIVRAGHPRIGNELTLEHYRAESHVLVEPAGSRYEPVSAPSSTTALLEHHLEAAGVTRRIAVRVPHFITVPALVRSTDLIATVPWPMHVGLASEQLRHFAPPLTVPSFEVKQFWHERNHHDHANRWLRNIVAGLFLDPSVDPPEGTARI